MAGPSKNQTSNKNTYKEDGELGFKTKHIKNPQLTFIQKFLSPDVLTVLETAHQKIIDLLKKHCLQ